MSSFVPTPIRTRLWKCPKCGTEKMTVDRPSPWIHTCLPFFGGGERPPVCPKCKVKMIRKLTLEL